MIATATLNTHAGRVTLALARDPLPASADARLTDLPACCPAVVNTPQRVGLGPAAAAYGGLAARTAA